MFKHPTLLILCALMLVSGCRTVYEIPKTPPENAPPEYKMGWKDGCESGFSTFSNYYMKMLYSFAMDIKLMQESSWYNKAWNDSYAYCRSYMNRLLAGDTFSTSSPALFANDSMRLKAGGRLRMGVAVEGDEAESSLFRGLSLPGWDHNGWGGNTGCKENWLSTGFWDCPGMGNLNTQQWPMGESTWP